MIVTNFSLIDFENGNTLQEAELDFLFNGIHTTFEGMLFNFDRTPLLPDSFVGDNKIPAVINNSLFSIDSNGDIVLVSKQSLDDSVAAAAASATTAFNAPGTSATSSTSLTIGGGSKTFTIQVEKSFAVGQWVAITDTAAPSAHWMAGGITSYDSVTGVMSVDVATSQGNGSYSAWTVAGSAPLNTTGNLAVPQIITAASVNAYAGADLTLANSSIQQTVVFPSNPNVSDEFVVDVANGRYDTVFSRNGQLMATFADDFTWDSTGPVKCKFIGGSQGWRFR